MPECRRPRLCLSDMCLVDIGMICDVYLLQEIFSRKKLENQLAGDLCSADISKPGLNSWTYMAIFNVVVCALAVILCGKNV